VEQQDQKKGLDRRNIFTVALAALSGAALAKLAGPEEAEAGHDTNIAYDSQTTMHLDVTNTTAGSTRISSNISGTAAMVVLNNYPVGISRPDGLLGRTTYTTSNCAGVAGASEAASGGIGVLGTCNNQTGCGVFGHAQSSVPFTPPPAGTGVHGEGRQRGISGKALHADGYGVVAEGLGTSPKAARFIGSTRVEGLLEAVGPLTVAGNLDAAGPLTVAGSLTAGGPVTVAGGLQTSGKVPAAIVEGARTYPHASLSPVFEHIGQANLRRGRATVTLPADFDALVPGAKYQVFLTEYGNLGGLYVGRRTQHSFTVRSRRATARGVFGYRVMVMRDDLKN
jgi:hypothetical protein